MSSIVEFVMQGMFWCLILFVVLPIFLFVATKTIVYAAIITKRRAEREDNKQRSAEVDRERRNSGNGSTKH